MKSISVIGLGNRGTEYMSFIKLFYKKKAYIKAICDINPQAIIDFKPKYNIQNDLCFSNTIDFFKAGVLSDGLIISTQDKSHYEICKEALITGYKKIMLEKPVSDNIDECIELYELAKVKNADLIVCHVLRYANYFIKIKDFIKDGVIGDLVHIDHTENVGYFHFAHSYVRGNWKRRDTSTPALLAKCCHDIDLLYWFIGSRCDSVSSYGELKYFNKSNAPVGATEYCLKGCKVKDKCPYDCEWTYLTAPFYKATFVKYNHRTMTGKCNATKTDMYKCLNNTSYGKCVYLNDNDVCDYQVVNMHFENGVTANHILNAFSKKMHRSGHIMGTKGEIIYYDRTIIINVFGKYSKTIHPAIPFIPGHGEADLRIVKSFVDLLYDDIKRKDDVTTIKETLESHKIVMAAEESRLNNSKPYNPIELYK